MKATTVSTLISLLSLTSAATVTLQPTPCLNQNVSLDPFSIEVGSLVVKDLPAVCGLSIASASDVDAADLTCRAFKDAAGKEPGSAEFTVESPALIATNPVQEKSLLCEVKEGSDDDKPSPSQATSNSTETPDIVTQVTFITASLTGGATQGTAAPSNNATVPGVTGGPTAQPSNPSATGPTGPAGPQETGAGSRMAVSAAAVALGFAVMLL